MSDVPIDRRFEHRPLRVKVETGMETSVFVTDPRIAVEQLVLGSDEHCSKAVLSVFGGPIFASGERAAELSLSPNDVLNAGARTGFDEFIGPNQRVIVFRDNGDEDEDVLFQGFVEQADYSEVANRLKTERPYRFTATGMWERLSAAPWAQVLGRWMRTGPKQDDLDAAQARTATTPIGTPDDLAAVTGVSCTFNAGGRGNRAAAPVTCTIEGEEVLLHCFCDDGDPSGKHWTWAQALNYLFFFHVLERREADTWEELGGLVLDGEIIDAITPLIELAESDRPEPPAAYADALKYALLGRPTSFGCDGLNAPEALVLLAEQSGVRFRCVSEAWAGDYVDRLYCWARGAGTAKDVPREGSFADRGRSAADVLAENVTNNFSVAADYRGVVTNPRIVGDVRRYEITTELVPGWRPETGLDNVTAGNVEAAIAAAEAHWSMDAEEIKDDEWYKKYHRRGSEFQAHQDVGRRWVLNETGLYRAADYARSVGPYDANRYIPWEPTDCDLEDDIVGDDGLVVSAAINEGDWARVGRPLLDCFSADAEGRSLGVVVEVSFDSGVTWEAVDGLAPRALDRVAGVYLDAEDLSRVCPVGDDPEDGAHFWQGIIAGNLRLRVTAAIEGDERIEPNLEASPFAPLSDRENSQIFSLAEKYHSNRRDNGNSQFRVGGAKATTHETIACRNDLEELQRAAVAICSVVAGRPMPATFGIPWLTTDYAVGDSIREVTGLGIELGRFEGEDYVRYPDVVAVVYTQADTRLVLDDARLVHSRVG